MQTQYQDWERRLKDIPQTRAITAVAQYIIEHKKDVIFLNTKELAEAVGVSDASVLRFVRALGYNNYLEFRESLQSDMVKKVDRAEQNQSPYERYLSRAVTGSEGDSEMAELIKGSVENIQLLTKKNPESKFDTIVDAIIAADKKFVIGVREDAGNANHFSDYIGGIVNDVIPVTEMDQRGYNKMMSVKERDAVLILCFKRYAKPVLTYIEMAKEAGAKVFSITDFETSPITLASEEAIICSKEGPSFFGSNVAEALALEILMAKIGNRKKIEAASRWKQLDQFLLERNIY